MKTIDKLTFKGQEYPLSLFSDHVQVLVHLSVEWQKDKKRAESKLKQVEVALEGLTGRLMSVVEYELKAKANTTFVVDTNGQDK